MKHVISLTLGLFGLWLLLSAHFEPLLLGLGLVSTALTVYLALRMEVIDHESHPLHLTVSLLRFWTYLSWQIVLANLDVALRVLGFKPISPTVVSLPLPLKTDLGRVIYANALTLTPGTASLEVTTDYVVVHALTCEGADDLRAGHTASLVPDIEVHDA